MANRPYLLTNSGDDMNDPFASRVLNDGEAEVLLLDLDRQAKIAAEYYKQRDACLTEIKDSKGSTSKIGEFQRLIAERDFIYNQEQEYLKDLGSMRGLYFKKKEIDRSGDRAPVDLLEKIRGLVIELKAKRNRIESQKLQYASKFEKKKYNIVAATLNSSSAVGLGASLFKIKGVDEEMKELAKRIEKVENLKTDARKEILNSVMEIDPKIVQMANQGGASSYGEARLRDIMAIPDYQTRAKNLSALRNSLEILNNGTGTNLNRPNVSMDAIIAGSRVDTSNPQMQNMLERLARSGGGGQSDSLDQLVKQKELQDGVSGRLQMMNQISGFNNSSLPQELSTSQLNRYGQGEEGSSSGGDSGWNDLAAKAAIKVANEKVNRLIKEARQAVDDVKLSIQMSHDRVQDRSMEESKLKKVAQTEIEVAQAMALLPYSKDVYQYKSSQLNEIARERRELEKLLLEQKLANRAGGRSLADKEFQERQHRIKDDLRKAMGEKEEISGEYNMKLGFDIHFDYVLEIPNQHQSCQVVFGIYKQGIPLIKSIKTDTHVVEITSEEVRRSLFGEKKNIGGVRVDKEVMMFFELQFSNRLDKYTQGSSHGWTALDLFTEDNTLKTGKFRLPFYPPPLDVNLTKERISYMLPMPETYMYVRINHPSFAEERLDFNFFTDLANIAYTVPLMHDIRESEALGKADDIDDKAKVAKLEEDNRDLEEIIENQKAKLEEMIALDQARYLQLFQGQNMIYGRLNKDPFADLEPAEVTHIKKKKTMAREEEPEPGEPEPEENDILELAKEEKPCKGLKVTFKKVEKLLGTKPFRVEMKIYYDSREMTDERGELIEFTSDEYKSKAKTEKKPEDVPLKDVVKSPYNFKGLFDILKRKKKKVQNCYIRWRILRKDDEVAWGMFALAKSYKINEGIHKIKLYPPASKLPPLDEKAIKKLKEIKNTKLEFKIELGLYNSDNLEGFLGDEEPSKKEEKKKPEKVAKPKVEAKPKESTKKGPIKPTNRLKDRGRTKILVEKKKEPAKNLPYLPHTPPVHDSEEIFEETHGIDILIDQIRFPPTNCTIVKICVRIVDKGFRDLIKPVASIPKFDSEVPLPVYNFRVELRKDMEYAKTSFIFLVYVTIDQNTEDGKPGILGYSFFPLFLDKETGDPATDKSTELLIHNGHYQLPVYCQDYPYKLDFDIKEAMKLERYPCCTTLIRVLKPQLDDDGEPLGIDKADKPEDKERIWPKFLSYRENHPYCNKYISVWPNEDALYKTRFKDLVAPTKILNILKYLLKSFSEDIEIPLDNDISDIDDELEDFLDKRFYYNSELKLIDPRFIYPYSQEIGFKYSIDGIFQSLRPGFYQVIISINPPAAFYNEPPELDKVVLFYQIDWDSSVSCLSFQEGYLEFRQVYLPPNSHMIISIKEMVFTKEKAGQASDVGFTIVPLIDTKGFFYTGTYQIPLFKKDITKSVAEDIQKDEPWRRLIEFMELKDPKTKKRLIELLQPVSVIVRLKDNYYQNLYETPYDTQRMKYYMLPDTLLDKYIYDEKAQIRLEKTRKMKEILPKGAIGLEFNELLRRTMGMAYNVQFEEEEAAGSEKSKKDDGEDDN